MSGEVDDVSSPAARTDVLGLALPAMRPARNDPPEAADTDLETAVAKVKNDAGSHMSTHVEPDWTWDEDGVSNSSEQFVYLCRQVERIIRSDGPNLLAGHADSTARLIMAQLAHKYGLVPKGYDQEAHEWRA